MLLEGYFANGKDKHKDHDQHAQVYGHPVQGGYAHGGEHDKHKKDKKDKKHKDKDKKKVDLKSDYFASLLGVEQVAF